jgi:hypothetical protein
MTGCRSSSGSWPQRRQSARRKRAGKTETGNIIRRDGTDPGPPMTNTDIAALETMMIDDTGITGAETMTTTSTGTSAGETTQRRIAAEGPEGSAMRASLIVDMRRLRMPKQTFQSLTRKMLEGSRQCLRQSVTIG